MLGEVQGALQMLADLHESIKEQYAGIDAAGLNWVPEGEEATNSLYAIGLHIAAAERVILGYVLNEKFLIDWPEIKQDGGIFKVSGESTERVFGLLDESLALIHEKLPTVSSEMLDQERRTRNGLAKNARWWMLHLIDHAANHLGHLELSRQLYLSRKK